MCSEQIPTSQLTQFTATASKQSLDSVKSKYIDIIHTFVHTQNLQWPSGIQIHKHI